MSISRIHIAGNGQDAWKLYYDTKGKFDLIMRDWKMPVMSGLDLLLRVRERNEKVPFIMLTVMSDREHVAAAAQSGVTDYVGKPFTLNEFQGHIRKIMRAAGIK